MAGSAPNGEPATTAYITAPLPACKPAPPAELTPEQSAMYDSVLANVSTWTTIPATTLRNAPQAELQDYERMWLTRECLLRYLRASKWHEATALKRLQSTLSWRREFGADTFTGDYISEENETGKQVQLGYDNEGRPCLYLIPARQNTKVSDRQLHSFCYMLDRIVDLMPPGVEKSALLIDFKGAASGTIPSISQARTALAMLQSHNPERLGRALITHTPWYVNTFFKLISPLIDPVTRDKMKFNEDFAKYVPREQLWDDYGGSLHFQYDHSTFWPAFVGECDRRRAAYRERWEKGGKRIGEYEAYLRGGDQPSLSQLHQEQGDVNGAAVTAGQTDAAPTNVAVEAEA